METRKIIIAMPTEDEFMPSISRWAHEFNWTKCEAYFVHTVQQNFSISEMTVIKIPDQKTFDELKPSTIDFIKNKARGFLPDTAFKNAHFEVFCDQSPANHIAKYAKEIDANMIVVATRHKKGIVGFFTSSFADRMLEISPCDILILRPDKN
jgi:nucleotide-binding universal stress UspA family protein